MQCAGGRFLLDNTYIHSLCNVAFTEYYSVYCKQYTDIIQQNFADELLRY